MNRRTLLAALVALLATPAVALATSHGPTVTIRIEGAKKTLLLPTQVSGRNGWITKSGVASGQCSGKTAQGALDVATHGRWTGTWYASYHEYLITSILGETPKGADYWTIFVDNRSSTLGACDIRLAKGEQLLIAVTNGKQSAAVLSAPHSAIAGHTFEVKLVGYPKRATPLDGVRITGNGIKPAQTNRQGVARITDDHAGVLVLQASPKNYVRTEAIVHIAS